ncbi:porin family protein [Corticibacterium sp. UT-5YL-CI-8]|nr:porin family protein [Tianweitania sp. UT-5YL-CI-8]
MRIHSRIRLALAATIFFPMSAMAADYIPVVQEVPVEVGSGWYLRGDIGYSWGDKADKISYNVNSGGVDFPGDTRKPNFDDTFNLGAGVGYRFTDYFRADATVDGFRSTLSASDPWTAGTVSGSADFTAVSLMANGYVDLGTYVGFTPYIGAGLGSTYMNFSDLNATLPDGSMQSIAGDKDWRFTYALMAGVAYDVTKNMKLDLGYKYRHIKGGDMFDGTTSFGETVTGTNGDLSTHEVRVGLRYELW